MTTIQIRIDNKTKKEAKKILNNIGMDMSSAIKVYLTQIVVTQGIPFPILTENGLTIYQENKILQAAAEAEEGINTVGPFEGKDAINYLKKLVRKNAH